MGDSRRRILSVCLLALFGVLCIYPKVVNGEMEESASKGKVYDVVSERIRINTEKLPKVDYKIGKVTNFSEIRKVVQGIYGYQIESDTIGELRDRYGDVIIEKDFKELLPGDIIFFEEFGTIYLYLGDNKYYGNVFGKEIKVYEDKYDLLKGYYKKKVLPMKEILKKEEKLSEPSNKYLNLLTAFDSENEYEDKDRIAEYLGTDFKDYKIKDEDKKYQNYIKTADDIKELDGVYINYVPNSVHELEIKEYVKENLSSDRVKEEVKIFNFGDIDSAYIGTKLYSELTGKEMLQDLPDIYVVKEGKVTDTISVGGSSHEK